MSASIEALIELKATRALAEEVAERVRKELNLEARVGVDGNSIHAASTNGINHIGNRDAGSVAERTIVVRGVSANYPKAEGRMDSLRGMLKNYPDAVLAASDISDDEKAADYRGHR